MLDRYRPFALLVLVALAIAAPASAARVGRLVGRLVDPAGKPVPGVTVTATAKTLPDFEVIATSDAKGLFMVDIEKVGVVYTYKIEKPGYVTMVINETWNVQGTVRREFTLAPGGPPPPQEAADEPLASASNTAVTSFNEGVRLFKAGDHRGATARFEQAVRDDPALRQAWAALAQVHLDQKRHKEAAEAAEKAIALGTAGPSILRVRWEAYRNLDDAEKARLAREELEKAGRLEEDAKRIHNDGVALVKIENHAEAFKKFQEAAEIDPSLQQAWVAIAVTGLKIGRNAEAAAAAKKVLELEPGNPEAVRLQYNAALAVGEEAGIVDALVALGTVEPEVARSSLYTLARKAFDADDAARAKERFGKLLELDANHPRANYYMGVLLVREGDKARARTHLQKFLRLAPSDPEAGTAKGLLGYIGG